MLTADTAATADTGAVVVGAGATTTAVVLPTAMMGVTVSACTAAAAASWVRRVKNCILGLVVVVEEVCM